MGRLWFAVAAHWSYVESKLYVNINFDILINSKMYHSNMHPTGVGGCHANQLGTANRYDIIVASQWSYCCDCHNPCIYHNLMVLSLQCVILKYPPVLHRMWCLDPPPQAHRLYHRTFKQ